MDSNYYSKKMNYFSLYVLELEQDKYYVGLSHNVEKCFKIQKDGECVWWKILCCKPRYN